MLRGNSPNANHFSKTEPPGQWLCNTKQCIDQGVECFAASPSSSTSFPSANKDFLSSQLMLATNSNCSSMGRNMHSERTNILHRTLLACYFLWDFNSMWIIWSGINGALKRLSAMRVLGKNAYWSDGGETEQKMLCAVITCGTCVRQHFVPSRIGRA